MTANRITGPGYYPRRPTKFVPDQAWMVYLCNGSRRVGSCPWLGSGTYRFTVMSDWASGREATHWVLAAKDYQTELKRYACSGAPSEHRLPGAAGYFECTFVHESPGDPAYDANTLTRSAWSFVPWSFVP